MRLFLLLFTLSLFPIDSIQAQITVIPFPNKLEIKEGKFLYAKGVDVKIIRGDDATKKTVQLLSDSLKNKKVPIIAYSTTTIQLNLQLPANSTIPSEGYVMDITPTSIVINSTGNAGLFYGVQTFLQLLRTDSTKSIDCMTITDEPAFAYRGMHLDVSRHFFEPAVIKKYLDVMAKLKLNHFHWHLTDDQGWRIEIKKYPKLTEIGSVRTDKKGNTHSGYYTQEQIKEIVQYAKERYISILPEIDFPGHASAIIAAYPQFGCYNQQISVPTTFGIKEDILCPSDSTIQFLKDVMDEVCQLFPGKYIHIGGDEVPSKHWNESLAAKTFAAEKNIPIKKIHDYFIQQIETHLAAKGRKCIGWGEIADGELSKDMTVMSWRGIDAGVKSANKGNDVIMTPRQLTYFDYPQDWEDEKKAIYMVFLPLNKVYGFDPYNKIKSAEAKKHIIGGQACLWTEHLQNEDQLFYQLFPRITALAECLWTNKSNKNFGNYAKRLKALKNYFVKERELPPVDLVRIKPKKEKPKAE